MIKFVDCITHIQAANPDETKVNLWFDEASAPVLIAQIQASIDKAAAKQAVIDEANAANAPIENDNG